MIPIRILLVMITLISTAKQDNGKIDLILLSKMQGSQVKHICVAGNNEPYNAITFLDSSFNGKSVSRFVYKGKNISTKSFNCDFDDISKCEEWPTSTQQSTNSKLQGLLITDQRWEIFSTNVPDFISISSGYKMGFSIRFPNEESMSIILSTKEKGKCYWIEIMENNMSLEVCYKFNPKKPKKNDSSCEDLQKGVKIEIDDMIKWQHCAINIEKHSFIISMKNKNIPVNLTENETLDNMYFHSTKNKGQWKFHKYSFLSLNNQFTDGNWHNIGPELDPMDGVICVTLYAASCRNCTLDFEFNNQQISESLVYKEKVNQDWHYYKLVLYTYEKRKLHVKTNTEHDGFWYIDDVRQCHPNEIRIVEMETNTNEIVSCQALNETEVKFNKENKGTGCPEEMKIGSACNILCSDLFGDELKYCNNYRICTESLSTCASGSQGDFCQSNCSDNSYGYNCEKKCGDCTDYCPNYTKNPCYQANFTLVNSTLTTVTVQVELSFNKNKTIEVQNEIQYRDNDNESNWTTYGKDFKDMDYINLINLKPLRRYTIKVVLFNNQESNIAFENYIFTDCENVSINKYTNVIISNLTSQPHKPGEIKVEWIPVCNGSIEIKVELVDQISCNVKVPDTKIVKLIDKNHKITNLIPNTRYNLKFGEDIIPFTTKGIPKLETPPVIINSNLTSLTLRFYHRNIINSGNAKEYEVQYRKQIVRQWSSQGKTKLLKMPNIFTLHNLERETNYLIRVVIDRMEHECLPTNAGRTSCLPDLTNYILINNLTTTADTDRVNITWTAVCRNTFNIEIICRDKACKNATYKKTPSIPEFFLVQNLTPYSNYTLVFLAEKKNEARINFTTKPTAAPNVIDLQIWSLTENSVFVRFKEPTNLYGELEKYETKCSNKITSNIIINEICKIWNGYKCLEIQSSGCNDISVAIKNKDVEEMNFKYLSVDKNKKSDKPVITEKNLTNICFQYPIFVRGKLKSFAIKIELHERTLLSHNFEMKTIYKNIETTEKKYCKEIKDLPPSTTFKVTIQVENDKGELGTPSEYIISSLPPKPVLENEVTSLERTNRTQKIKIPNFVNNTTTENSTVYVVVCDPSAKHPKKKLSERYELLKKWSECNTESFWVDAHFNNSERDYIIDNLRADINYTVTVVGVNEYKGNYSIVKSSLITSAPEPPSLDPALYLLFLLFLIVPIIGFIIWKYMRKSNNNVQALELTDRPLNRNHSVTSLFRSITKLSSKRSQHTEPLLQNKNEEVHSKVVKVCDLSQYVKESIENQTLAKQHAMFPKGPIHLWDYGMCSQNRYKNRYNNITAYDHNRVILNKVNDDLFSDFINASYIDGYNQPKAYIATQGPKPNTVSDFWRMIWQEEVICIVMLANLVENKKNKCHQYWPEPSSTEEYYDISIKITSVDISADFVYRYFDVTYKGETRKIQHLHFTSWPDHGVPIYSQSLVPFLRKMLMVPTTKPIVVHCSAGVGRTGTIILTDICLRMAASENQVDVLKYMQDIREQRVNLVDNYDQYLLVHMLLLECILAPETNIPCNKLKQAIQDIVNQGGLHKQMNYLKETAWQNKILQNSLEINEANMYKNRFADIVPTQRQIFISRYPYEDENADYINAVPVDGYGIKDRFIVTQNPLAATVQDFWRMVAEEDVRLIVSLNQIHLDHAADCIFWPPNQNSQTTPLPYVTLTCESIREANSYDIYNILLKNNKEGSEYQIRLIQFKNWNREELVPGNSEELLKLLEEAQSLSRQGTPVVVTCYDGAKASGLYVALSFVVEKMKLEQICDVCQAVRTVRINRPQFVSHIQQFEFLYHAALNFLLSFDEYSNFEVLRK